MLLRLPLNLVGKLLQSVLSGRRGSEPAQVLFALKASENKKQSISLEMKNLILTFGMTKGNV